MRPREAKPAVVSLGVPVQCVGVWRTTSLCRHHVTAVLDGLLLTLTLALFSSRSVCLFWCWRQAAVWLLARAAANHGWRCDTTAGTAIDVTQAAVNDGFCDCADGSDEPMTSACGVSVFSCEAHTVVWTSMVVRCPLLGAGLLVRLFTVVSMLPVPAAPPLPLASVCRCTSCPGRRRVRLL